MGQPFPQSSGDGNGGVWVDAARDLRSLDRLIRHGKENIFAIEHGKHRIGGAFGDTIGFIYPPDSRQRRKRDQVTKTTPQFLWVCNFVKPWHWSMPCWRPAQRKLNPTSGRR